MLEYTIAASRTDAHGAVARTKQAELTLDTDPAGRVDAFNPAELLLTALAACILKSVERAIPVLHFELRHVDVRVHGVRSDKPPRLETIHYEVVVDSDESDHRLDLLHVNIRKYGTIFNTLTAATNLTGTVTRGSTTGQV